MPLQDIQSQFRHGITRKRRPRFWRFASALLIIFLLCAAGVAIYFYMQHVSSASIPAPVTKEDAAAVVEKVGKLIDLPVGETPTLVRVADPSKVADQPFFAHAQAGDQMLLYTLAGKAFLYRPSTNMLIEVATFH